MSKTVYDIGNFVGNKISDFDKKNFFLHHWIPPKNYVFPYSTHNKQGKEEKRYSSHKYLNDFKWLIFLDVKKRFFCKYCPLFVNLNVGGLNKNVQLSKLVTQPLTFFTKLLGKDGMLMKHQNLDYYKSAVQLSRNFFKVLENPKLDVVNQINNERLKQVIENRRRLKPIIESIIFLVKYCFPRTPQRRYNRC